MIQTITTKSECISTNHPSWCHFHLISSYSLQQPYLYMNIQMHMRMYECVCMYVCMYVSTYKHVEVPLHEFNDSSNSAITIKLMEYFKLHRYCAHRRNTGICSVLIKKPAKSNWGTNKIGNTSIAVFISLIPQPMNTAVEPAAIDRPQAARTRYMKKPWKPTI